VNRPYGLSWPISRACGQFHTCATCQGFSGDYDTYLCGCRCHWCPAGLHKPGECDCPAP
jgi:hypothetical protein